MSSRSWLVRLPGRLGLDAPRTVSTHELDALGDTGDAHLGTVALDCDTRDLRAAEPAQLRRVRRVQRGVDRLLARSRAQPELRLAELGEPLPALRGELAARRPRVAAAQRAEIALHGRPRPLLGRLTAAAARDERRERRDGDSSHRTRNRPRLTRRALCSTLPAASTPRTQTT